MFKENKISDKSQDNIFSTIILISAIIFAIFSIINFSFNFRTEGITELILGIIFIFLYLLIIKNRYIKYVENIILSIYFIFLIWTFFTNKLLDFCLIYLIFFILIFYLINRKKILFKKNISKNSHGEINFYKELLSKHKKENEIKDKQITELNKKNILLENTKKNISELLEDALEEKNISELNVQDLEKFKLAVENSSDQIIITDIDGKILYANRSAELVTGYSRKEIIGNTPALWGGQMSKEFYKHMWQVIKQYKTVYTADITNKRKNGQEYIANIYISPILNKKNEILFFVAIERDITKEKEIDTAKTEFVSLASHQLRTPLSAINWYTELLISGDAGEISKEQKNYLKEIHQSSKKMSSLVNALLNVSRIEMGTFVIRPRTIDIVKLCKEVIKELDLKIKERNTEIIENYKPGNIKLKVDKNLMHIIFYNLISNAIKYNKIKGKTEISIIKDRKFVSIKVADTGYGIPVRQQEMIFDKLFRADNVKQKNTQGTGLGLYIVKSILEKSGGVIWFKSKLNKGTTFYVSIPVKGMKEKEGTKSLT